MSCAYKEDIKKSKRTRLLHDETEVTAGSVQISEPLPSLAGDGIGTVARRTAAVGSTDPPPVEHTGISASTTTGYRQGFGQSSPRHISISTTTSRIESTKNTSCHSGEEHGVPAMQPGLPPICELPEECGLTMSIDNMPGKELLIPRRESFLFENTYAVNDTDEMPFKAGDTAKGLESTFDVKPSTTPVNKSENVSQGSLPTANLSGRLGSTGIPRKPYGLSNRDSSTMAMESEKKLFSQYSRCPGDDILRSSEKVGIQYVQESGQLSRARNGAVEISVPSSGPEKKWDAAESTKGPKASSDVPVPKKLRRMSKKPEIMSPSETSSREPSPKGRKRKKQNKKYTQKRLFPTVSAPAGMFREKQCKSVEQNAFEEGHNETHRVTCAAVEEGAENEAISSRAVPTTSDRAQNDVQRHDAVASSPQFISGEGFDNQEPGRTRGVILIKRELCLYPISIMLCLAIIAIILVSFLSGPATGRHFLELMLNETSAGRDAIGQPRQGSTCGSSGCPRDAAYLDNLLSWDVDPCDNFYRFVCGRWASQHFVTDDQMTPRKITVDDEHVGGLETRMHTILKSTTENNFLRPLQNIFRECISVQDLEKAGWDPLLELLAMASLEGFPFTPPVRSSVSVWEIAAKVLKLTGAAVLLNVDVVTHPKFKRRDVVALDVPDTFVDSTGGDINEAIGYYYGIVYTSVKVLRKEFIPAVHTMQVVNFAYELESLFLEKRGMSRSRVEAPSAYPELIAFLSETFDGIASPAYQNNGSDVLFRSPNFTTSLLDLIRNTEAHTAMNFLGIRLIVHASAFTPQTDLSEAYGTLLYRKPVTSIPRWQLCVRVAEHTMPPLFLLAFLLEMRAQSFTTDLFKLVKAIVDEVASGLDYSSFLDDADKAAAKNIVATTQYKVLGLSWLGDKKLIKDYLSRIPKMVRGRGLMSYVELHQHGLSTALARDSSIRWTGSIFRTDCWVEGYPRTIHIPILIFNLSSLAIAHESKAFQLPRAGVRIARCIFRMLLEAADSGAWLSKESRRKTDDKLRCLRDQYGPGVEVSTRQLEDNVVVHLTFKHFAKVVKRFENGAQLHLPHDKDLLAEQLFFVYLMMQSCKMPALNETNGGGGQLPVNVPFQNERGFTKAFGCRQPTPMNPPQKCLLWETP